MSEWKESFKGRVTELVGKTKPIMVSQEVSDILTELNSEIRTGQMKHTAWQLLANLDDAGMAVEDAYKALANGWEIRKETLYNVKVPHTKDVWYFKASEAYLQTICPADDKKLRGKFTKSEIEHYGLQECEKEEVTDDEQ
jgi:hypothetical protein